MAAAVVAVVELEPVATGRRLVTGQVNFRQFDRWKDIIGISSTIIIPLCIKWEN